jgi:hypothetical protein
VAERFEVAARYNTARFRVGISALILSADAAKILLSAGKSTPLPQLPNRNDKPAGVVAAVINKKIMIELHN